MQFFWTLLYMLNEMSPYILLGFFIAGLLHAFVPTSTMARHLSGGGFKPVAKAAALGIPLPLCSCGVLPTAIAMNRGGASKAATTGFLIATPQTGVDSIAATWSLLGPAFAVIRPVAALVTSLAGGMAVGRAEHEGKAPAQDAPLGVTADGGADSCTITPAQRKSFGSKLLDAMRYGFIDLVGSIGGWLVAGLLIAALITIYVPDDFFGILGSTPILSMIVAIVVAVPMYVCATGSIPIALSLMMKGLSPGTALVLLMAGPAANFASFTLISRQMGRRAAVVYLSAIVAGAIAFGLLVDYLLPREWFMPADIHAACHHGAHAVGWFATGCSAVLVALLAYTFVKSHNHKQIKSTTMSQTYKISGMNCQHCRASVEKAIQGVEGVTEATVDLASAQATVNGTAAPQAVIAAVRAAGFDAELTQS